MMQEPNLLNDAPLNEYSADRPHFSNKKTATNSKKTLYIVGALAAIILIALGLTVSQYLIFKNQEQRTQAAATSDEVIAQFDQQEVQTNVGQPATTSLLLTFDAGTVPTAGRFVLTYDPNALFVQDVSISKDFPIRLSELKHDDQAGVIELAVARKPSGIAAQSMVVATISYQVLAGSTHTTLNIDATSEVSVLGSRENVLSSRSALVIRSTVQDETQLQPELYGKPSMTEIPGAIQTPIASPIVRPSSEIKSTTRPAPPVYPIDPQL